MEINPLGVPFLYGEYDLTVDSKNRLLVPSEIRKLMVPETDGEAFFLTLRRKVPCLFPDKYYKRLVNSQILPDITPDEDQEEYDEYKFGLARLIEWDAQGRIVLPEKIINRAELGREVTLVGRRDHLAIRNRGVWEKRAD